MRKEIDMVDKDTAMVLVRLGTSISSSTQKEFAQSVKNLRDADVIDSETAIDIFVEFAHEY